MLRSLPLRSALLLIGALLVAPASAQAAQITGDPLSVSSDDNTGRLGAAFTGSGTPEFCCSSVDQETGVVSPGNAGFVVVTVNSNGIVDQYGSRQGNVTPTSAPTVTGDGSAGNPFRLVQTFNGGDVLDIRQELIYVNGDTHFRAVLNVTNKSSDRLQIRASMGADLLGGGNDRGTGLFEAGPPRFVGGFNLSVGSVAGLFEITGWSHYEEGQFGPVLSRADADPRQEHLLDTVDPTEVDNGAAVQWDGQTLSPGRSAGFEVGWRFSRTFDLDPERALLTTGDIATFKVKLRETGGNPQANVPVRWTVAGINNAEGVAQTNAQGEATFEYIGANPGSDFVSVFADLNSNGQHDEAEPRRQAQVVWAGLEAPAFGEDVNLKPVSGRVLVRLPRNAKVHGKWAHAAQSRFVPLTSQTRVPVGAELDTTRGNVQLTSSKGVGGGVQTSQFYSGRFSVSQRTREGGITEVKMTEPIKCQKNSRGGKVTAAAKRSRRLWGRGKGRFRTRGRHSSATVRGTQWLTKDTCTTTTTSVKEGTVIVKDFAKRKNVRVKAPKRYVARARRR